MSRFCIFLTVLLLYCPFAPYAAAATRPIGDADGQWVDYYSGDDGLPFPEVESDVGFTVRFLGYGSAYNIQMNSCVEKFPPNPVKAYHAFLGWYTDKTYTDPFTATTPVTQNRVVYPRFVPKTYQVTFNPGKGRFKTSPQIKKSNIAFGAKITKPANPTRKGSVFAGWYSAKSGGKKMPATLQKPGAVYYAHWK